MPHCQHLCDLAYSGHPVVMVGILERDLGRAIVFAKTGKLNGDGRH